MEDIKKIKDFISIIDECRHGYGCGCGHVYGYGYGCGNNHGNGDSGGCTIVDWYNGDGYGNGCSYDYEYGNGYGNGDGYGIKAINGMSVYMINDMPTIITHAHNNIAEGAILKTDLTLEKCYIAKQGYIFAHGRTLEEAMSTLTGKLFNTIPEENAL